MQERAKERAIQFMQDPDLDHYASEYILGSLSENTLRAYESDVKVFRLWCESRGFNPMPATPTVVANFLAAQAKLKDRDLKGGTIVRRAAAIRYVHRMAELPTLPTDAMIVRQTIQGILREKLLAPQKKSSATYDIVRNMVDLIDTSTLLGLRDRALLLLGFAGAFRRSELVAVRIEDLQIFEQGMDVTIRQSKTDQTGKGKKKPIIRGEEYCPVQAVHDWLDAAGITEGFIFRGVTKSGRLRPSYNNPKKPDISDKLVALVVKKYVAQIGFDPALFAGHSLRRGFITSGLKNGKKVEKLIAVTGQTPTTLFGYYHDVNRFEDHAGEGLL